MKKHFIEYSVYLLLMVILIVAVSNTTDLTAHRWLVGAFLLLWVYFIVRIVKNAKTL